MQFKRAFGKPAGVTLNAAEQRALDKEIKKQCAEFDRKNSREIVAMFLWVSHEVFGHGPKRMKRQYKKFNTELKKLLERYEMDDTDGAWLCTYKLNQYLARHGTCLDDWYEENDDS